MTDFTVFPTRAGDYLVRSARGTRDEGRFGTPAEAEAWIDAQHMREDEEAQLRSASLAAQSTFDASVAELNRRQIAWQTFRNGMYERLSHEGRRLHAQARWLVGATGSPASLDRHAARHAQELDDLERFGRSYDEAVHFDLAIKTARRQRDARALAAALRDAEKFAALVARSFPF